MAKTNGSGWAVAAFHSGKDAKGRREEYALDIDLDKEVLKGAPDISELDHGLTFNTDGVFGYGANGTFKGNAKWRVALN